VAWYDDWLSDFRHIAGRRAFRHPDMAGICARESQAERGETSRTTFANGALGWPRLDLCVRIADHDLVAGLIFRRGQNISKIGRMALMQLLPPSALRTITIVVKIAIILYFMNSKLATFAYQNF
jgi:hypothetical protein